MEILSLDIEESISRIISSKDTDNNVLILLNAVYKVNAKTITHKRHIK
jgi:hypothetical protein